jgi:DNA modification methylase
MEYKKISEIKLLENNPRTISDRQFKILCTSIKKNIDYFEARPLILSDRTGELVVIAGNQRYKAAEHLGLKEVPTYLMKNLTEETEREIVIRDNISNGDWDFDLLANEWNTEELEDWGLEGFPFEEVTELEAEEDDYTEPDNIQVDVVLGDLIQIGEHRLLCGDSTDSDAVAKLMDGNKADMVFTDPPYGVSYTGGHNEKKRKGIENDTLQGQDLTNLFRDSLLNADLFSKDYSAFYIWFSTNKAQETFLSFSELNLEVRAILCWYKVKSGLGAFMAQYIPNFEPCIYAFKKGKSPQWFGASDEKSVWELKKDQRNDYHPTQKPIELPERAIKNSSKLNDLVYDCFLGSGSTMVAAHQLKRKCYGMELDPKYCQVIIDRMSKLDPLLEVKINGVVYNK